MRVNKKSSPKFSLAWWLGIYVLVGVLLNIWVNIYTYGNILEVLWFCDFIAFFLVIGMLCKNKDLVSMILVMAVPSQFLWIMGFVLWFAGIGIGRMSALTDYGWFSLALSVNLHAFIIPISAYGVYKFGFSKRSLVLSWLVILTLVLMTFVVTEIEDNINCVFFPCDDEFAGDFEKTNYLQYFTIYSLLFWPLIYIPSFFLFKWLYRSRS